MCPVTLPPILGSIKVDLLLPNIEMNNQKPGAPTPDKCMHTSVYMHRAMHAFLHGLRDRYIVCI